jgi:hypothetical protein
MRVVGITLIVLGLAGVVYGGITWTSKEKVVDLGPLQVSQEKKQSLPLPPVAGAVCLVAGTALVLVKGRPRG